jgi:hypothetical protein
MIKRHWRGIVLVVVAVFHLGLVGGFFYGAIFNPYRAGLAPIIVYVADLPASLLCELIDDAARRSFELSYSAGLLVDWLAYSVIGTLWWVSIFWVLTWPLRTFDKES